MTVEINIIPEAATAQEGFPRGHVRRDGNTFFITYYAPGEGNVHNNPTHREQFPEHKCGDSFHLLKAAAIKENQKM